MGQIHAVIFDLDGTLIDTEKYYLLCWPKAMEHFGYSMTREEVLSIRSLGRPFAPERLKEISGDGAFDYPKVRAYRKELIEECIREHGIPLKPYAKEVLAELRARGIKTALATANDYERASRYLKKIGLFSYFDEIACANMVKEGKPSPDIYAYACRQCGYAPEECMAVEDSPNGMRSAARAGCRAVMVPDLTQPDEEIRQIAHAVVPDLRGILELV